MPCSPSTLSSARPPRRLIVPVRPTPASGSRNPDGESGKRPFVTAVLLHAGGSRSRSRSRPLRFLALLPGHIHCENRLSDMAVVALWGKEIKECSDRLAPVENWGAKLTKSKRIEQSKKDNLRGKSYLLPELDPINKYLSRPKVDWQANGGRNRPLSESNIKWNKRNR